MNEWMSSVYHGLHFLQAFNPPPFKVHVRVTPALQLLTRKHTGYQQNLAKATQFLNEKSGS